MKIRRFSLTVSILAFLSCLLLFAWLLFSLLAYKTLANDLYAQKGEHAKMLLTTFGNLLPEEIPDYPSTLLLENQPAAVYANKLAEESTVDRMTLLDRNGKVLFTVGRDGASVYQPFVGNPDLLEKHAITNGGRSFNSVIRVNRNNSQGGTVGITLTLAAENARLARSRTMFMAYFAIDFILLVGLGAYILSRIVVAPVNRLLTATEKITGGQYGQRIRISGSSELAMLAESFNEMSQTLLQKHQQVSEHLTALERANSELRQAREETVRTEKMASIGLLAAGMAHEIGTPLASIMGYADLTASEELDSATIKEYATRIAADCARIDRIIRGLLDYSRPRDACVERCDLKKLINETTQLLLQQGLLKGIETRINHDSDQVVADVDTHQLQQVLINLILNSRDAMPSGGILTIRTKIEVDERNVHTSPKKLCIDVSDTGSGIPENDIPKIFDPFFTTKPPGKGTGLGLAISARIIESFGGRIFFRNMPGQGACFTVTLPEIMS